MELKIENPFPGPQPYRAADGSRFFGRTEMAYTLESTVLATRCVTVYGPSGAGKSSLVQAAVLPSLIKHHEVRSVLVDGWPEDEKASTWLANQMYTDLGFGALPASLSAHEAVLTAAQRAARRSERLMLVYLDQIEQLLYPGRRADEAEAFFECVEQLVELPYGNVRVLLSLREDYLGRFRDRLRDRRRLVDRGFRVGPLTVAELTRAMCQTAAIGVPSQNWARDELKHVLMQVRVPGQAASEDAEAVAAYGQIVCRALFERRARGDAPPEEEVEAEPIMRSYLETTLEDLGEMKAAAQQLLETHLVTEDGSRTLRTEKELLKHVPAEELAPILKALERAAILHAEEHQGSRYFELGHDWLAKMVNDLREQRLLEEERKALLAAQEAEHKKKLAEAAARLQREQRRRRILRTVAAVLAVGAVGLGVWALRERINKQAKAAEATDMGIVSGFRELSERGQLSVAMKLLLEAQDPGERRGWISLASDALRQNALRASLQGHQGPLTAARWSPDGKRVLTASTDATARVWSPDGKGEPVLLEGHTGAILDAAWSRDGKRVVTASADGTARVWSVDRNGAGKPVVLKGDVGPLVAAAWSPDGRQVLTVSQSGVARVQAVGGGNPLVLRDDRGAIVTAAFHPDARRVFTGFKDGTVRLWNMDAAGTFVDLAGHTDAVLALVVSPNGKRVATGSRDGTARIWDVEGGGEAVVLQGHESAVNSVAWSADSALVATGSADGSARVWSAGDGKEIRALKGHTQAVVEVAFRPDGKFLATASVDRTVRLWRLKDGEPLVLREHQAPVAAVAWSPDGKQVVTAAGTDPAGPTGDYTAKVWSTDLLQSMPRHRRVGVLRAARLDDAGARVIAAYDDSTVLISTIQGDTEPVLLKGHDAPAVSVSWSSDGKRVLTASLDGKARIYPAGGGAPLFTKQFDSELSFAAWSPDGKRVVTLVADRTARVWNADGSGTAVSAPPGEDRLTWAAWSPDGARIVIASHDGTARIWKVGSADAPIVLKGHESGVLEASWSPDGKRVLTASEDRTARIWDAEKGVELVTLRGHQGAVLRAIWSPDGARVATSSADKTIWVWRADGQGTPIALEADAPILALRFLDEGKKIVGVASDGESRAWTLDVGTLLERLKAAHTGCLPPDMRALYLGEPPNEAKAKYTACEDGFKRKPAKPTARKPAPPPPAPSPPPVPVPTVVPTTEPTTTPEPPPPPPPPPAVKTAAPRPPPPPASTPPPAIFKPPGGTKLDP